MPPGWPGTWPPRRVPWRRYPTRRPLRPDWVVVRPTLHRRLRVGRQAGADGLGRGRHRQRHERASARSPRCSGTRSSAEVVALGPEAEGLDVGQRVVLNPWLSCRPRGIDAGLPGVRGRRPQPVLELHRRPHQRRASTPACRSDATGGYAELMPAHPHDAVRGPRRGPDRARGLRRPVRGVAAQRHPPPARRPVGKVMVWGAGALGTCAVAILRALHPDVEVGRGRPVRRPGRRWPRSSARTVFRHGPQRGVVEGLAAWSGGVLSPTMEGLGGLPMCHPGGIDVVYDTIGRPETFEVEVRVLQARGTLVKSGVHAARPVGVEPALLQGDQLGRLQRLRHRGGRRGAPARDRALPRSRPGGPHRPRRAC